MSCCDLFSACYGRIRKDGEDIRECGHSWPGLVVSDFGIIHSGSLVASQNCSLGLGPDRLGRRSHLLKLARAAVSKHAHVHFGDLQLT
jgi:hypothetical protein